MPRNGTSECSSERQSATYTGTFEHGDQIMSEQGFETGYSQSSIPLIKCGEISETCSEVSHVSYGLESRHKTKVAKVLGRNMRPSFLSKGYYQHCFEELPEL